MYNCKKYDEQQLLIVTIWQEKTFSPASDL